MKAFIFIGLLGVALVAPAQADVRSYCEAYARHQADVRLSGNAVLGGKPKLTPEEWEERKTLALADCLTLYTPEAQVETSALTEPETPAPEKPKTTTKAKEEPTLLARKTAPAQEDSATTGTSTLVPGSRAWLDYCAAKYVSFNRETRTYQSYSGKQRPCLVTKG